MPEPIPDFAELLESTRVEALHLEMRDVYAADREAGSFAEWLHTGVRPTDPDGPYWREWVSQVRAAVARGVTMRRLRIVSEPVSEYVRYGLTGAPVNAAAGEDVRYLPRHRTADLLLPGLDLWCLDRRLVRFHHFDGDGRIVADTDCHDPTVAVRCADAFEMAWERAIPYTVYRPA